MQSPGAKLGCWAQPPPLAGGGQVLADLPATQAQPERGSGQNHEQEGPAACGGLRSQGRPPGSCLEPARTGLFSTDAREADGCPEEQGSKSAPHFPAACVADGKPHAPSKPPTPRLPGAPAGAEWVRRTHQKHSVTSSERAKAFFPSLCDVSQAP